MKRTFINCWAVLLIVASAALASLPAIPLEELLEDTDVIVVARLTNVRETTKDNIDNGSGTLTVTEVIRGAIKTGDKLGLEWANHTNIICPRVEHAQHKDKTMIWLLRTPTDGTMSAVCLELKDRGTLDTLLKEMTERPSRSIAPKARPAIRKRSEGRSP